MVEDDSFSHVCDCDACHGHQATEHQALFLTKLAMLSIQSSISTLPEPMPRASIHEDR
jgi:cytochrome c553